MYRFLPEEISTHRKVLELLMTSAQPFIEAVLLAAGTSSRMGTQNKLTKLVHGKPLIRIVAQTLLASEIDEVCVVLGHEAEEIRRALNGLDIRFVVNGEYHHGQASSIVAGIHALSAKTTDVMICLGDMPFITAEMLNQLLAHHRHCKDRHRTITCPIFQTRRGNPVIWGAGFFNALRTISGDIGGRMLIDKHQNALNPVAISDVMMFSDLDTEADFAALSPHVTEDTPR